MRMVGGPIIAVSVLIAVAVGAPPLAAQTVTDRREAAVRQARAGQTDQAIAALRAMLAAGEDDGLVAMDLTVLLQQARRPGEAVAAFETAAVADPPDYALQAAVRAYRDLGRPAEAERLARRGLQRFPQQPLWPVLLALVLTDAGRPQEALTVLGQPQAGRAPVREQRMAEGYAWRKAGEPFRAMAAYLDVLDLAPADAEARAAVASILNELGAAYGAQAVAGGEGGFAPDEAAAMVRWGEALRPPDPARRFEGTDAALARLDELLAALPPPPATASQRRRLRLDRLVALRDRVRMAEVVQEGGALRADGPLPAYAEEAYADALLYLRRREEARDAYRRVLAQSPTDVQARYGLVYASVELEDFVAAYPVIDALVKDEPIWRLYQGDPSRHPNPERAYAEIAAAKTRLYAGQLDDAWVRIDGIVEAAPANGFARQTLYEAAAARGWPRRAKAEAEIAASLDPDALGPKIALAEVALADFRFADARRQVRDLLAQYPEDLSVQRLARELDADQRWTFETEIKPSNSEGGGANASGQAWSVQSKLTTPPIADHWQAFAQQDYTDAHPPEGFVGWSRASVGVIWRDPDIEASVYASPSWGSFAKTGAGASLDWAANDQVRLALAGEHYSWDTPLRAVLHGISADSVSASATYRWSEAREFSALFGYMPFSDGNQRFSARAVISQALVEAPHFDLAVRGEIDASHNNRPDAPYFNPDSDLTVQAGFLAEHVLWRRYETILTQALSIDAGVYAQARYAGDLIATVSYEHRWRFDPYLEFHYGVQLSRRVYDGEVENTAALTLGLRGRF